MSDRDFDINDANWFPLMNEMVDKFMTYRMSGTEWQVLWMFMRCCYGYHKSSCDLRWKDMKDFTGLHDGPLGRAIEKLKSRNILCTPKNESKQGVSYKINSKLSTWKTLPKTGVLPKLGVNTPKNRSKRDLHHNIKNNKYNIAHTPKNGSKKKKKTVLPENFTLTEQLKKYALDHDIDSEKLDKLFESFKNYHLARRSLMVDWNRAWYTWVQNAPEFSKWALNTDKKYKPHFFTADE